MSQYKPGKIGKSKILGKYKKGVIGGRTKRLTNEEKYHYYYELPKPMDREEAKDWLLENWSQVKREIGEENFNDLMENI